MYKQQAITDIVTPIQLNNVSGLDNLSDNLQTKGDKVFDRLYKKQSIEANNILDRTMSDLYDTYSDNPAELEKQFIKAKEKIIKNANNKDLKVDIEMNYLSKKNSFLINADRNFKIKEDNETKQSIFDKANNLYKEAGVYYMNKYAGNNTPETDTDYKIRSEILNNQLQTKGNFNQHLFNNIDLENIQKNLRQANMDAFYNYANQTAEIDINKVNDMWEEWNNNPASIIEKYDLTQKEYEEQKNYLNKLKSNLENNSDNKLTTQQKIQRTYYTIDAETRYNEFNIETKNNRNVIGNKDLNNINSLIDFRNYINKLKNSDLIDDKKYQDFILKTNIPLNNLINQQRVANKSFWGKTGEEYIAEKLNDIFKDKNLYIEDRIFFYETVWNTALENGIDLKSTENKNRINDIINNLYQQYVNDRFNTLKSDVNSVLLGNNVIIPFNKKSTTTGDTTIENGGYKLMEDKNGNQAYVLFDDNNNVLDIKNR